MVNHLVSNLICCVKNASAAMKSEVCVLSSGVVCGILSVLKQEGFIKDYQEFMGGETGKVPFVRIFLRVSGKMSAIKDFSVISKPGRRLYTSVDKIPSFYDGLGMYILSTNKGVLSDKAARESRAGGELLCSIF